MSARPNPILDCLNVLDKWSIITLTLGAFEGNDEPLPNNKTVDSGFISLINSDSTVAMCKNPQRSHSSLAKATREVCDFTRKKRTLRRWKGDYSPAPVNQTYTERQRLLPQPTDCSLIASDIVPTGVLFADRRSRMLHGIIRHRHTIVGITVRVRSRGRFEVRLPHIRTVAVCIEMPDGWVSFHMTT
jgi:hypothetical protein